MEIRCHLSFLSTMKVRKTRTITGLGTLTIYVNKIDITVLKLKFKSTDTDLVICS